MKLGVIGQGFVGGSVYEGMKNYFETFTFDINGNCTESSLFNLIEKSDMIFSSAYISIGLPSLNCSRRFIRISPSKFLPGNGWCNWSDFTWSSDTPMPHILSPGEAS